MNSDRHQVQLYVEGAIGCADPMQLPVYKTAFENFTVGNVAALEIETRMQVDASAYTVKGLRSLLQGLSGLDNGHETWSVIKLYYSMYFFMRAKLAFHDIAFLRCKNIYTLRNAIGAKPEIKKGDRYRGDHKATISIFESEFSSSEYFLSQKINEATVFQWYAEKREWVNYKRRDFIDGFGMEGLMQSEISYLDQVRMYCANHLSIFPFDPDYAVLALPVSFALSEIRQNTSNPQVAAAIDNLDAGLPANGCARAWMDAL
jgi:hypothetical protein